MNKAFDKKSLNILVAEDDQSLFESIHNILKSEGHTCSHAKDGQIACSKLQEENFDLVLSDIQMPNMTGIDLVKWIKGHRPVSTILMSGFSDIMSLGQALELGAVGFIPKPFQRDDLLDYVHLFMTKEVDKEAILKSYVSIPLAAFAPTHPYPFHLYIKMGEKNLMKVNHRFQKMDLTILKNIKNFQTTHLVLHESCFQSYLDTTSDILKNLIASKKADSKRVALFYICFGKVLFDEKYKCHLEDNSKYLERYGQFLQAFREKKPELLREVKDLISMAVPEQTDWLVNQLASGVTSKIAS